MLVKQKGIGVFEIIKASTKQEIVSDAVFKAWSFHPILISHVKTVDLTQQNANATVNCL